MRKLQIGDVFELTEDMRKNGALEEYVVTSARMSGGGTAHGPHDIYPDGWEITARRLQDGKYIPDGETISFYQSGCFTGMIEEVPVLRKMSMTFQ